MAETPAPIHRRRENGLNENHVMAIAAVAIAVFLRWLVLESPELPVTELIGSRLLPLGLYFAALMLVLTFFGGFRFQLVERLKSNVVALAIVTAAIILGAALVLGH